MTWMIRSALGRLQVRERIRNPCLLKTGRSCHCTSSIILVAGDFGIRIPCLCARFAHEPLHLFFIDHAHPPLPSLIQLRPASTPPPHERVSVTSPSQISSTAPPPLSSPAHTSCLPDT